MKTLGKTHDRNGNVVKAGDVVRHPAARKTVKVQEVQQDIFGVVTLKVVAPDGADWGRDWSGNWLPNVVEKLSSAA